MNNVRWIMIALLVLAGQLRADSFAVQTVTPADGERNVDVDPLIQIHTSSKFDARTATNDAVQLRNGQGALVRINISADLGGVVTISPREPLQPDTEYTLSIGNKLKSSTGQALRQFQSTFRTTAHPETLKEVPKQFRFTKKRVDRRDGICGLALANDLFACTWDGQLFHYPLDADGNVTGKPKRILHQPQRRFLSLVADPTSTPKAVRLWLSHDSLSGLSLAANDWSGTLSRISIIDNEVLVEDFIVGLPTGDHPATGLTFAPDGTLTVSQGATTMLGGRADMKETPLSAATLSVDLNDAAFANRPINVRTDQGYNPKTGPVKIVATGIRSAYDLCWHSNGQLYAGVNMNDTNEKTPKHGSLPAVAVRPAEMMLRIVPGKYYGHPNPSRNEWVLLGGNPTTDVDPWEVPALPVGTRPERNFDPTLLIRNLERDKGPSADGVVEWTKPGPLQGCLLFTFYTATRGIHAYTLSANGHAILDQQYLATADGKRLTFGAPLDIVFHPSGKLYIADISAPARGDSGKDGGIWICEPLDSH